MKILRFTKDHEWLLYDPENPHIPASIGITDYAQQQLGDIVFIEFPESGIVVMSNQEVVIIESVKAASEVYAPVSGTIEALNTSLEETPGLVNTDPLESGWLFKMSLSDPSQLDTLMDEDAYQKYIESLT